MLKSVLNNIIRQERAGEQTTVTRGLNLDMSGFKGTVNTSLDLKGLSTQVWI